MKLSRHLRLAFHDWMWDPKSRHPNIRRLCQRLPVYFTDPHLDGIPRDPDKFQAWFDALGPVDVEAAPGVRITSVVGFDVVDVSNQTSGSGVTLRWHG